MTRDLKRHVTNKEILYCLALPTQYGNLVIKKFVDYNSEIDGGNSDGNNTHKNTANPSSTPVYVPVL